MLGLITAAIMRRANSRGQRVDRIPLAALFPAAHAAQNTVQKLEKTAGIGRKDLQKDSYDAKRARTSSVGTKTTQHTFSPMSSRGSYFNIRRPSPLA
jgi:hypothetical protein